MKDFFEDIGFYFSLYMKPVLFWVVVSFLAFPCIGISILIVTKIIPNSPQFCEVRK